MNKVWLIAGALVVVLLVGVVGFLTMATVRERAEMAARQTSSERPEGADVYIEVDAQTLVHPWSFSVDRIEVRVGERVAIGLRNSDVLPHDLVIGAPFNVRTAVLQRGETQWVVFTASRATAGTPFWCSVPGHRQNGMHGLLVVKGG